MVDSVFFAWWFSFYTLWRWSGGWLCRWRQEVEVGGRRWGGVEGEAGAWRGRQEGGGGKRRLTASQAGQPASLGWEPGRREKEKDPHTASHHSNIETFLYLIPHCTPTTHMSSSPPHFLLLTLFILSILISSRSVRRIGCGYWYSFIAFAGLGMGRHYVCCMLFGMCRPSSMLFIPCI